MKPDLDAIRAVLLKNPSAEVLDAAMLLLAYITELEAERDGWAPFNDAVKNRVLHTLMYGLPPTSEADEAIVGSMLAQARAQATKRPIREDVDRRRAEDRCSVRGSPHCWNRDGDITRCANCAATRVLPTPEER